MLKITEIAKRIKKAKQLMNEYIILDAMLKTMVKSKKKQPIELDFDEGYYERVVKRIKDIKQELNKMLK